MPGIFISYRREDSGGYAGRLFDILSAHFGSDRIFMDLATLKGGDDYAAVIKQHITACDVLVAMIGEHWVTITGADGTRRLDAPGDFVRLEIVKALQGGVRVIPVLVSTARMPHAKDLPEDLAPLGARQGIDLRDAHFREDAQVLIDELETIVPPAGPAPKPKRKWPILAIIGVLAAVALAGTILLPNHAKSRLPSTPADTYDQATTSEVAESNETGAQGTSSAAAQAPHGNGSQPGGPSALKGSTAPPANLAGKWTATVTYDWPNAVYNEIFHFEVDGSELSGTASILTGSRAIVDGKIEGNRISFTVKSTSEMDDKMYQDLHHYRGTVQGNTISFSMITESEIETHEMIHFTATRAGS